MKLAFETTEVKDNGRRGAPRLGCDCVQCFGYCLRLTEDAAARGYTGRIGIPEPPAGFLFGHAQGVSND